MSTPIGKRIAAARDLAGMSQRELATQMGLSKSLISHWERGARLPKINQVKDLARILKIDPDRIFSADTNLDKRLQAVI